MAKDLISFLKKNPIDEMVQEVKLTGRLADYPFKIKPMSANQFYKYQRICTKIQSNKSTDFNSSRFNELVILNHVVEPDFKSAELLTDMGVKTSEELLNKFFLGGELIDLSNKISELSGFNTPDSELEDEVKNS